MDEAKGELSTAMDRHVRNSKADFGNVEKILHEQSQHHAARLEALHHNVEAHLSSHRDDLNSHFSKVHASFASSHKVDLAPVTTELKNFLKDVDFDTLQKH